ncbi:hypothetical protein HK096_010143, partial [Nowakowskiella sp. JEL0078]
MIVPFVKPHGCNLSAKQTSFNTVVVMSWVVKEHCIGMLKGRFPSLCDLRLVIDHDPRSSQHVLRWIFACCVLHNILVKQHEGIDGLDFDLKTLAQEQREADREFVL